MAENDERSPLWTLASAGALATGAGIGISRVRPQLAAAWKLGSSNVASQTAAQLANLGRFATGYAAPGGFPANNMLTMAAAGLESEVGAEIARREIATGAFQAILAGGRATRTQALGAWERVLTSNTAVDAMAQAKAAIGEFSGAADIFARRIHGYTGSPAMGALQSAIVSQGIFSQRLAATGLETLGLAPDTLRLAQQNLERYQGMFGEALAGKPFKAKTQIYGISDILGGQAITTPMMVTNVAGAQISIPLLETGYTYGGQDLGTRYLTRSAYYPGQEGIMSFSEFYAKTMAETLRGTSTTYDAKQAVISRNMQLIQTMRDRDAAARVGAVWAMPESLMVSGARAKGRLTALEAINAAGGSIDDATMGFLIQRGLFPFGSAQAVAKGTMKTSNVAEELYGPLAGLMGVEQQPLQFIRGEWGVTAASKQKALQGRYAFGGAFGGAYSRLERKIRGAGYERLLYGGATPAAAEAYTAPQLMAFYAKPASAAYGMGFESQALNYMLRGEEGAISKSVARLLEHETISPMTITGGKGFLINPEISKLLGSEPLAGDWATAQMTGAMPAEVGELRFFDKPLSAGKGGLFLGTTAAGEAKWLNQPNAEVVAAELAGGDRIKLYVRETHRMTPGSPWKFFSEDVKYMGGLADEDYIYRLMKAAGITPERDIAGRPTIGGQAIEAFWSGERVGKNKMAQITQQIEALSMFAGRRIDSGALEGTGRAIAEQLLDNPQSVLKVKELMGRQGVLADLEIQRNMVMLARRFGFSQQEMGLTFGLMGPERAAELGISTAVAAAPGVVGLSKARMGGLSTGAVDIGGLATMDPAGFRLLTMKGAAGQRFAGELVSRLRNKGGLQAGEAMLASLTGAQSLIDKFKGITGGLATDERTLAQLTAEELIGQQGRMVRFGRNIGGVSQIYVPGLAEAPELMASAAVERGEVIQSPIASELSALQRGLLSATTTEEELQSMLGRLQRTVYGQLYGKRGQGWAHGQVIGSKFLFGVGRDYSRAAAGELADDTFRISKSTGLDIFNDLLRRSESDTQRKFIQSQRYKFISGDTLVGGMWRHPNTGPESFQFVRYKLDSQLADDLISAPAKFGTIRLRGVGPGGEDVIKQVDMSQMVGFKGDFDRDMFALAAITDQETERRVAKQIGAHMDKDYTQYLFNHYAMKHFIESKKDKIDIAAMQPAERLVQGAKALTTAKTTTGQINVALSKLKLGLQYAAPEQYRPMAELFWHLEEAAIGSKHGVAGRALYEKITSAVKNRRTADLEAALGMMFGDEAREIAGEIKIERLVKPGGIASGDMAVASELAAVMPLKYDKRAWAAQAMMGVEAVGGEIDEIINQLGKAGRNLENITTDEIISAYRRRQVGSIDVAQELMSEFAAGGERRLERKANSMLRVAAARSRGIKAALSKAKGPIGLGIAGAAAIMLAAPSISGTLAPPENQEGPAAGKHLNYEDLGPPAGLEMKPPPPRIMRSPTVYDIGKTKMVSYANINMRTNNLQLANPEIMTHAQRLAESGRVNVRAEDDRSILDPRLLASKIHERL